MTDQSFFVTSMPDSRPADYYLGYMEGCVFIDFNNFDSDKVRLIRISFDGYGCCNLPDHAIPLDIQDSISFKDNIKENISDQEKLRAIVKKAISLNKEFIWTDALQEYELV